MSRIFNIENFQGWLNLNEASIIEDNQFEVLTNMFYDKDKRIQSRRWIKTFWNAIWTKPITSYFFYQNDTTWDRHAFATAWTDFYEYDEWSGNWVSRKTWLSEFEADGVTRTRWSFAVYLNVLYLSNGVDSYASYDPATTTYTEYPTQPKVRYLQYMQDALFGAWADANPNALYYTNALPLPNASTLNTNDIIVWWDEQGKINGLKELGNLILIFKDKKIYTLDVSWPSVQAIDAENGWYWHRIPEIIWNSLLYFNDRGYKTLTQRSGVSWSSALETTPLSDDVRPLTWLVTPRAYNYWAADYILPFTNYYTTFDTTGDRIPDKTLVYSALNRAWSEYSYPAHNDYWYYIDSDWNYHYLIASANTGQMYEIETWFSDFGQPINCELKTKKWDSWDITRFKTTSSVDITWLKTKWDDIEVNIIVDGEVFAWATITDDNINITSSVITIWTSPIWTSVLWGWVATPWTIPFFRYVIRIPMYVTGQNIQVQMTSSSTNLVWTLDKIMLVQDLESIDLFSISNIW